MMNRIREFRLWERLGLASPGSRSRSAPTAPARRRRVPRREREARRQRHVRLSMIAAGALIFIILAGGALNEYVIKPRTVLASVEDADIRRQDYWKVRSVTLYDQVQQYQQFATMTEGEQQFQFMQFASQLEAERGTVWGSTDTDPATLERMIEDQIYLQSLDEFGLSISDEEIDTFLLQQFALEDAPILTPTPEPTLIPTRAAWATETVVAEQTAEAEFAATEAAFAETPVPDGTPLATPVAEDATPIDVGDDPATPDAVPDPATPPEATPIAEATPEPVPTLSPEDAVAAAEAEFERYQNIVFDDANMSRGDFERLVVRPLVARDKIQSELHADIGQTAEQVHAAHILVATRDLADQLHQQLMEPDADFEQIARDQSTDPGTAPNGGDLGWFTRAAMVQPFTEVAFSTEPGDISAPFETDFGWHIVKVYDHDAERPLTDAQIAELRNRTVQNWLEDRRQDLDIDSDLEPTPTPFAEQFEPPPDAPPPPVPTPDPATPPGFPDLEAIPEVEIPEPEE